MQKPMERSGSPVRKVYECLQGLHFLHRLKLDELEQLLASMKRRKVSAGSTVYAQGERADAFFLVVEGRLEVLQRVGFWQRQVAVIGEGQYFGDNSLLGGDRHSSSVVAETDCDLFVLYKGDFDRILMANAEISTKIRAHRASLAGQTAGG
jgi:CRP-like cAMP-binding protein